VIPRKVIGKFSIRLVPDMIPEVVSEQASGAWGAGGGGESGQRLWCSHRLWGTEVFSRAETVFLST
jgi:hypothetical protein